MRHCLYTVSVRTHTYVHTYTSIVSDCSDTVTGLCYVPPTGVLWVAAGTPLPLLYEPKSGDNVSTPYT